METEIFDKETILDLMVNFIPLGIIFFFIAAFVLYDPWGFDPRTSGIMLAIMGTMFVALAVLTYISGKAIAGDEKRATVYPQGQAGLEGAEPIHEHDSDREAVDAVDDADTELEAEAETETETETGAEAETEAETETETKTETTETEPADAETETATDGSVETDAAADTTQKSGDGEPSKTE